MDKPTDVAPEQPGWPLKMTPQQYLERWPSGQYAELARSLIG